MRGVRDPDAECDVFDPMPNIDWLGIRIAAPGTGDCYTDGHYLCFGCRKMSASAIEERRNRTDNDPPGY